jgi:signal transduction histidine kinase
LRPRRPAPRLADRTTALASRLLQQADGGMPHEQYVLLALDAVRELAGAAAATLWLREGDRVVRWSHSGRASGRTTVREGRGADAVERRALAMLDGRPRADERRAPLLPVVVGERAVGVLGLTPPRARPFPGPVVQSVARLAPILGSALVSRRAHAALHERVKELTCLYGITQLAERPDLELEALARGVCEVLPPAWQYPEVAVARVVLDGCAVATGSVEGAAAVQAAPITVNRKRRGTVEVAYLRPRPPLDEGPFLKEERHLINAVAAQLALVVGRREAAAEKLRLEAQLRHADRLATVGRLAAGLAHELNEPLGNVLGFAQLATRGAGAGQLADDLAKIVTAALHAREIVKKLMLFARQAPLAKERVDLNALVEDGMTLLEPRCARQRISTVRRLARKLPPITADPTQLRQVLVNLAVNAIQAMPDGGTLTIGTLRARNGVRLTVEDTGVGIREEDRARIFLPFFTTKDVDEGTGLGLSVVHGIVAAHGGTITVESEPQRGTRFEVSLPLDWPAEGKERNGDVALD